GVTGAGGGVQVEQARHADLAGRAPVPHRDDPSRDPEPGPRRTADRGARTACRVDDGLAQGLHLSIVTHNGQPPKGHAVPVRKNGRVASRTAVSARAKLDQVCADAVELARAAITEEPAGEHLEVVAEGERVVTHFFAAGLPGYRGWRWAVTVARAPR